MSYRTIAVAAAVASAAIVSACADNNSLLGTSSNLTTATVAPPAPKADPVCAGLAGQIDQLRREGIADKVDKATQKKAKVSLTAAETAKADQLNKANFEFQAKCSTYRPTVASASSANVASASTAPKP